MCRVTLKAPNVPSNTAKHEIICHITESSSPVQCSSPVNIDTHEFLYNTLSNLGFAFAANRVV